MKTVRRLIYRETLAAVAFVTLAFLALFFFFDFVDELQWLGKSVTGKPEDSYQLVHILAYVCLVMPSHLYELLPITVLIGTIFVMARLAQSSEYTILRTSGLGPSRALKTLLGLGLGFVLLTFAVGDYIAPSTDLQAQLLKSRYQGKITVGQTGAWLKEKQRYGSYAVNVNALSSDGGMRGIRIFEFDSAGLLVSLTHSDRGNFAQDESWVLERASRTEFQPRAAGAPTKDLKEATPIEKSVQDNYRWPTEITAEMVSVALLKPERMSTVDLFQYIRHLEANGQASLRYEIEFWKKVFYPLSCLVMVVLALPFAYLHFRTGNITNYVFGGVMIGISFFLLNNVFGYIGNLNNWLPWVAAGVPGLIYSRASLGAFGWLVLRR